MKNTQQNGLPSKFSFFDDFLSRDLFNWNNSNFSETNTSIPAVNICENEESFVVEMAAPGMKKQDFTVQLDNNVLTISSQKSHSGEENTKGRYSTREYSYQAFQRSFVLPKDVVDAEKIEAKYEDGVLNLTIPKKEEAKKKQPKMIEIM